MASIVWNDDYNIGVTEIDSQNKKLITILNGLYESQMNGMEKVIILQTINEFYDYTHFHFSTEQQMHRDYKYPQAIRHKNEHQEFIDKLDKLKEEIENNLPLTLKTLDFLQDWMIKHIYRTDKEFGDYLRKVELQ